MGPERFAPIRRLRAIVVKRVRRRPKLAGLALVAVLVGIVAAGITLTTPKTAAPGAASGEPSFTYGSTWSLLELQSHIQAGEVVGVTTSQATDPGGEDVQSLVAKTREGQLVRIELTIDAGKAAGVIASLGHGKLLTQEAWTSIADVAPAQAGSDPLRTVFTWIVPIAILVIMILFLLRSIGRGPGASREQASSFRTILPKTAAETDGTKPSAEGAPDLSIGVVLADVAGCDEAKLELTETIEFLKNPERFRKLGAKIPRGIMLYGPPGTGKTMLARAVANEAGVAFIAASGAEFVEKYVGVGARRVRDLFATARKQGRAVVFVDEFDALGKARGGANAHEEREQTLNQLLVEMDGFSTGEEVVVIAATNRIDTLDAAALRPGRFSRKIHVGLPDVAGRAGILAVHAKDKPIAADVELETLARKTYGFSGAQLADIMNEAAILAARRGGDTIGAADLHGGWLKVAVGTSRRRSMDERERSIIAAHEIGHAICGRLHGDKRKVEEISLFAHGEALGVTVSSQEDNDLPAESDLRARLVALMGGRAAEELLFHEVTGGAGNDFDKANQIATTMVTRWGMGRDPDAGETGTSGRGPLGFLVVRPNGSLPSEVQAAATRAIRAILDEAYAEASRTLVEHMTTLRRLAAYLVEHERLDGETFDALFEGAIEVPNALGEWRPEAARPRAWGDIAGYHSERHRPPQAMTIPVAEPLPAPPALAPVAASDRPVAAPADGRPAIRRGAADAKPRARMARVLERGVNGRRRIDFGRRARQVASAYMALAEALRRPGDAETDPES